MTTTSRLELWAGVECTVNRVGDRYSDQIARTGHADRLDDLDRLTELGIAALRTPVLWERVAPNGLQNADWSWTDARLDRLRARGVRPIVTLLHHGSGPRDTSLLDPDFPARFAEFADACARRYAWIEEWTPINEPLTTARFSALYGMWYPHAADDRSFARAFVHQIDGIRRAMRAIRAVVPNARLVQTEDLGKTHSVPSLAAQAHFENTRRWLTFDLLCGTLAPDDVTWEFLTHEGGLDERTLASFVDAPCPPDVLGINHYLTSERFLDRRLSRYPSHTHGGNGRERYADVEAVRVLADGPAGPERLLCEAWVRYGRPIAITECHLACTREQQMRWLHEVWTAAVSARTRGADVRAVTAWAAFGSYDWASLLTRDDGRYEPGVFDVRGAAAPRATALAAMLRGLATTGDYEHPALEGPGWWEMPSRLLYPSARSLDRRGDVASARERAVVARRSTTARPVLVTSPATSLGRAFVEACDRRGLAWRAMAVGTSDPDALDRALDGANPWAIVDTGAYTRVDDAEREREACWDANVHAPAALARRCAERGIPLVTVSSHLVFDGDAASPYVERDTPRPVNALGTSMLAGEREVLGAHDAALVLRLGSCVAPWDDRGFVARALRAFAARRPFRALADVTVTATFLPTAADAALDLVVDGERGVWHLANAGAVTWSELAVRAARHAGLSHDTLVPVSLADAALPAPRPRYSALASERGLLVGDIDEALADFVATHRRLYGSNPWLSPASPVVTRRVSRLSARSAV